MRKILIVMFVLGISILSARGEDPNLLFEIKFDSYAAIADFAKGQSATKLQVGPATPNVPGN